MNQHSQNKGGGPGRRALNVFAVAFSAAFRRKAPEIQRSNLGHVVCGHQDTKRADLTDFVHDRRDICSASWTKLFGGDWNMTGFFF